MTLLGQVDTEHTTTPWYVTWMPEYMELHIQSAPEDSDNHVLTMSYRHEPPCPTYSDFKADCDPAECVGLREVMANAKLIVESVNEVSFGGQLLINTTLFDEVGV